MAGSTDCVSLTDFVSIIKNQVVINTVCRFLQCKSFLLQFDHLARGSSGNEHAGDGGSPRR